MQSQSKQSYAKQNFIKNTHSEILMELKDFFERNGKEKPLP